jgi:hypothetical protein
MMYWSYSQIVAIVIYLFDQNVDAYENPRGVNSYYGNNLAAYGGQPDDGYLRKLIISVLSLSVESWTNRDS